MCGMEYRLKKGSVYEGKVEKVDFPNKATVWVTDEDGHKEKAIVKNAIPGQTVRFCVNKKRKGHCEGRLMEVVEKSPLETNPACPHFGKCGGCTYQTVAYEEQLKIKSAQVEKLLSEVVSGELPFEGIIGSPVTEEYRNKMEFSFGDEYKDGPLALGLHKRNSMYDIVPVTECKIIDEDYRKILTCVQDYAIEKELPFLHKLSHEGYLRHLLVRKSVKTGQILVDIVTTTQIEHDFTELVNRLTSIEYKGTLTGVLHTFNDSLADAVINEKTELLYGQDYIEEELLGLRFKITPFSFFQTNSLGAEVLYSKAREYVLSGGFGDVAGVDDTGAASAVGNSDAAVTAKAAGNVEVQGNAGSKPVIYDLYTGTGTIAQMLSPVASKVIGVEIVAEAVEAAKKNAAQNGLTNCEFIADDVLKALDNIEIKPDFIVLDPPRDGIHPKALEKIIDYGVDRMVYISCKPTSLARDLVTLQERGYKVEKCCCVDMFPNTVHVETVVLLSKGAKGPVDLCSARTEVERRLVDSKKVKVDFSLEDMDLSEFKGKATYEQIKAYVLEQTGLKVSSLYIAQIKKKCGLDVGENFNLPKSENAKQPQCTPDKEEAIMQAFKHFGIV